MEQFSSSEKLTHSASSNGACVLSKSRLILILFGSVAVTATVVALAVYFGHPDKGKEEIYVTQTGPQVTTTATSSESPLLPGDIRPRNYVLKIRPDIYTESSDDFSFNGTVDITFEVIENTSVITLHQRDLTIDEGQLKLMDEDGKEIRIKETSHDYKNEFYMIHAHEDLIEGNMYIVHLTFTGPLKDDLKGIYWSSYKKGEETKYLVTSQLQSTDARKTFPCFDEPAMKATFNVSIERKKGFESMGNMDNITSNELFDDWVEDVYNETLIMSSYLLAFLVSDDIVCLTNYTNSGKEVKVCARSSAKDQLEYANTIAAPIQDYLEQFHAVEYPLPKTVHVAVPDFSAGAMENWGLILYRETALLYDEEASSAFYRQRVAYVIAHELAHMWFGNIVTCEWWDDIWLNEGFASYMENIGVDSQYMIGDTGESYWQMEGQFVADALQSVMRQDGLLTSHPVYQPVNHPDEISQVFDLIAYDKGSSIIRMINYFMGEHNFKQGLTEYLEENKYGVTTHRELFHALSEKAEVDVAAVMNTWILQMGYPVVTFSKSGNKLHISQDRFLYQQPESDDDVLHSPFGYKWIVPITYMTKNNGEKSLEWLQLHEKTKIIDIELDEGWILGNVDQRFYYRVNYDHDNWKALFAQLDVNHTLISIISRAQIIDDAFNLGRAGVINQTMALDAIEYMKDEQEYVPWRTMTQNIGYMRRMVESHNEYDKMKSFMQSLVTNITSDLGWTETEDIDKGHLKRKLRPVVHSLACTFGMEDCLSGASDLYTRWKGNETLSPNLAENAYCYGIKNGNQSDWDFALQKYEDSNVGSEQNVLMRSLACSDDEDILTEYLRKMKEEDGLIRDQDVGTVISAVSRNIKGRKLAWEFFKDNWDDYFFPRFGSVTFRMASIITALTESFSTVEELDDLQSFMDSKSDHGTGANAFIQAVETVNTNIKWREENEDGIFDWLAARSLMN